VNTNPTLRIKTMPRKLSLQTNLPAATKETVIAAIVSLLVKNSLEIYKADLAAFEGKQVEEVVPQSAKGDDQTLIMPTMIAVIKKANLTSVNGIKGAIPKVLENMSYEEVVQVYFYLLGMDGPVLQVSKVMAQINKAASGEAVLLAEVARLNDIPVTDAFASIAAGKKVTAGQQATIRVSELPPEVAETIVNGAAAPE
jgi:hypothetical protein